MDKEVNKADQALKVPAGKKVIKEPQVTLVLTENMAELEIKEKRAMPDNPVLKELKVLPGFTTLIQMKKANQGLWVDKDLTDYKEKEEWREFQEGLVLQARWVHRVLLEHMEDLD